MSRRRKYGEDLTYGEEHRRELGHLYQRVGHRLDMADRDWTEFCHWCKQPLAIFEEIQHRPRGRDLYDKATTVTEKLADSAGIGAALFEWRTERPVDVQAQVDELNGQLRELERTWPIIGFRARLLCPKGPVVALEPEQWWLWVLAIHRDHHRLCTKAQQNGEVTVRLDRLQAAVDLHPLHGPAALPRLEIFAGMPLIGSNGKVAG